ncbi:MAG: DNA primase [Candidatus Latescibacterota bacterium]|nr:MAG: DNA primase [Candidatus Latescibacterota bacterium]
MNKPVDRADPVEEVRAASDIVGVVGGYVRLRKAGRNHKGLCPFHKEKTPSFIVSPDRQTFHCFGCGKGGDVFRFIMEIDGVRFPDALRLLAERAGIRIPEKTDLRAQEKRERIFGLLASAARFYQGELRSASAEPARRFLQARRLSKETAELFGLGYAPGGWRALREKARSEGFTDEEMGEAGLVVAKEGSNPYDRFRDRLLFPIHNVGGRVIGFGGRILGDGEPKYLNSPETELFRKGEGLYGLSVTKGEIRSAGEAVLVEGYTDLLALYQGGIRNAVAPLGTAFTPSQARLLSNYAERVLVLFDGDEAGLRAALRSLETLAGEGLAVRVVELPAGSDPDSFLREKGKEPLEALMRAALPLVPFLLGRAGGGDRESGLRDLVRVLASMKDEIRRSLFVREAAERTGVSEEILHREVARARRPEEGTPAAAVRFSPVASRRLLEAERGIAYLGYQFPELLPVVRKALAPGEVEDAAARRLLESLFASADRGEEPRESVFTMLGIDGDFARLRVEGHPDGDPLPRLRDYVACLREEEINRRIRRVQEELRDAEERKDLDACARLVEERAALAKRRQKIVAAARDEGWDSSFRPAERSDEGR